MEDFTDKIKRHQKPLFSSILFLIMLIVIYTTYTQSKEKKAGERLSVITRTYMCKGKYEEALTNYLEVAETYPRTKAGHTAYYQAANCYIQLKEYKKALEYLGRCSLSSGDLRKANKEGMAARCHEELGNLDKAIHHYRKAADADKSSRPRFLTNLARVYLKKGMKEEARDCLQEIVNRYPKYYGINDVKKRLAILEHELEAEKNQKAA